MGIIEEITRMVEEGRNEQEIISVLNQRGYSPNDIANSISQMKIKKAVYQNDPVESDLQSSVMDVPIQSQQEIKPQVKENIPDYQEVQEQYSAPQYQEQYQTEGQVNNADIISEIAEQIVNEKLLSLKSSLEAVYDLKTSLDAKVESLDERIKRIEKTIDRLQLSVLQKVGEYITNVDDIKREMIESQKTFKALLEQNKKV